MDLHLVIQFSGLRTAFIAAGSLYENIRNLPRRCDQIHGSLIVVNIPVANPAAQLLTACNMLQGYPARRQAELDGMVTAVLMTLPAL